MSAMARTVFTTTRDLRIGMVGTFDVDNYGDLLFPLLAEAELSRRLGSIKLHCFSYHQKSPPDWPFQVDQLTEFPNRLAARNEGLEVFIQE